MGTSAGIVLDTPVLATMPILVLFLLLTSHGSSHGVALKWEDPLPYDNDESLDPAELRAQLDQAGIKWRIVMVSACSSGVFVDPLRNDFTLVATAAAADRKSFGCANGNDFTEFGRAVLGEQLTESRSFVDAFERARNVIRDREAARGLEPSVPQLFVGGAIATKLTAFETDAVVP